MSPAQNISIVFVFLIKVCPISSMLSLFTQVEPAISKQVEFSSGYVHVDYQAWVY